MSVTFTTVVFQPEGMNATGLPVPEEAVAALGGAKNAAVVITVGAPGSGSTYTYRSSLASRYGGFIISLSSQNRAGAKVGAGDTVEVTLELDDSPRTVTLPKDLEEALASAGVLEAFGALSTSKQRAFVDPVEAAKAVDTRARRVEKVVTTLRGE